MLGRTSSFARSDTDFLSKAASGGRMEVDLGKDVAEFRHEAQTAGDPNVKDFAARTLPTLESHLQMTEDISSGMSKATAGTRRHHD